MSSIAELRRLSAEQGERLQVAAADVVGKWIYFHGAVSPALSRAYCQAQRGGRILELQPTARVNGAPFLVALCCVRIVHVETVEEERANQRPEPRGSDAIRLDFLGQLFRGGCLLRFVGRLRGPHHDPDLRRVLDDAISGGESP